MKYTPSLVVAEAASTEMSAVATSRYRTLVSAGLGKDVRSTSIPSCNFSWHCEKRPPLRRQLKIRLAEQPTPRMANRECTHNQKPDLALDRSFTAAAFFDSAPQTKTALAG